MYRLLISALLVLLCFEAATAQSTIVPIVQGSYLLGGTRGGKWVTAAEASAALGEKVELIRLGLDGTHLRTTAAKGEVWGACPDETIIALSEQAYGEDESEAWSSFIGAKADWEPIPRKPWIASPTGQHYVRIVRAFLRTKGITRSPVKISQIIRIDLDSDGADEVLISASYARRPSDLSIGDYSFSLVRTLVRGVPRNVLIDGQFLARSRDFDLARHAVVTAADLNGDGKMEIAIGVMHSEGDTQAVYEFAGGRVRRVFQVSCGG